MVHRSAVHGGPPPRHNASVTYQEPRPFRRAEALRSEEDAVATVSSTANNDWLKDPAQSDVVGELGEFFLGELCPWVARVFIEAGDGHEERQAFGGKCVERDCLRGSGGLGLDFRSRASHEKRSVVGLGLLSEKRAIFRT